VTKIKPNKTLVCNLVTFFRFFQQAKAFAPSATSISVFTFVQINFDTTLLIFTLRVMMMEALATGNSLNQ
jgi:hypothetical protein